MDNGPGKIRFVRMPHFTTAKFTVTALVRNTKHCKEKLATKFLKYKD